MRSLHGAVLEREARREECASWHGRLRGLTWAKHMSTAGRIWYVFGRTICDLLLGGLGHQPGRVRLQVYCSKRGAVVLPR